MQFRDPTYSEDEVLSEFHHQIQNQALAAHWACQFQMYLDTCLDLGRLKLENVIGEAFFTI